MQFRLSPVPTTLYSKQHDRHGIVRLDTPKSPFNILSNPNLDVAPTILYKIDEAVVRHPFSRLGSHIGAAAGPTYCVSAILALFERAEFGQRFFLAALGTYFIP